MDIDPDELQIREVVTRWMDATSAGDLETVLDLMTEDVVFLLPGREPMKGKATFAAVARTRQADEAPRFVASSEIQEIRVSRDWAYVWARLTVLVTPPGSSGSPAVREGHTLSVFRKEQGRWRLSRDANLLGPVEDRAG
jgi:uncharacterized protein (TIGR02246 family)